ncbi:ABC transporter permease [Kitasatospora sp. NPDC056184]|uniref:ABC transporter permease n=1 Tax=Kitasatospora sp. NPDC056184 TaxID=3345738 RepID=UPI0035E22330
MSTSILTGPPAPVPADRAGERPAPAGSPPGTGRVLWLTWRQSRTAVLLMALLMVVAALLLVALHVLLQDRIELMHQTDCYHPKSWDELGCRIQAGRVEMLSRIFTDVVQPAVTAVPVLLGMFLGGPLLAQEYERGTLRLVLAQSVTPRRWLAARLAVPGAVVLLLSAVLSGLTSWVWWTDVVHNPVAFDPPFQAFTYPVLGVAPVVWSLFGLALGVLVGQLLRRTVAAVLVSGAVVAGAHAVVAALRPYFWPRVSMEQPYNNLMSGFVQPTNAWLVDRGVVLADGTRLTDAECVNASEACGVARTSWGTFHPVSDLVPVQLVEAGLLLVLTALVVAVVFRRLTRAGN